MGDEKTVRQRNGFRFLLVVYVTGNKIKANKMGIFVSMVRHDYDRKTATENKIQNEVRQ